MEFKDFKELRRFINAVLTDVYRENKLKKWRKNGKK